MFSPRLVRVTVPGIAGSNQTKTGLLSVRLGLVGFLIPFFFLDNPNSFSIDVCLCQAFPGWGDAGQRVNHWNRVAAARMAK